MAPADTFDKDYWEAHWARGEGRDDDQWIPPNPHLEAELDELTPGTALDAGCGEGAEAIWLATRGWRVTAVDISAAALDRVAARRGPAAERVDWVEADLSTWQPDGRFDLVTTFYAHPTIPQLAFYERIADWVAPGGTLLIVGHLDAPGHDHEHGSDHRSEPLAKASVTAENVTAVLDLTLWQVVTAEEKERALAHGNGRTTHLRDVVVRATRRGQ